MSPALLLAASLAALGDVRLPEVLDDRLQIQLVAAEPDVVTPTGLAVDARGRVLVIESHTHFRPADYQGPKADRILLLEDFDPATGKAGKVGVFFEGTQYTMNLAVYHDGSIYVATRSEIFRLRDRDDDGRSDERTRICHLETAGNYPHNGLSGFAFDFAGNVYFGFGENLGADYKLIGSDGKSLAGGGEGGNIYTCDAEGKNVRRVATGFWNPFHLCFDAFGRLFAVDNDPDSRPPCRLLHIVEGGDYGYRFRNGRKGVHPFTAWNGELPGTLPMVAGTGEAPCAVLAYESDNLPEEYRGDLLVTSWGDHRLERYRLRPRGASFSAEMSAIVRGDENFRPVGLALAPDGSLYFSDWVDKSYHLHGKGRVWRLSAKTTPKHPKRKGLPQAPVARLHADLDPRHANEALASEDPFVRQAAIAGLQAKAEQLDLKAWAALPTSHERLSWAMAMRTKQGPHGRQLIAALLKDSDPRLRLYGVIWVGEERLADFRGEIEATISKAATRQLFEAALATLDLLERGRAGDPKAESAGDAFIAKVLQNGDAEPAVRRFALRSLPADHPAVPRRLLEELVDDDDPLIRLEAIRTIRQRADSERWPQLREIAASSEKAPQERCEAILGLSPGNKDDRKLLFGLVTADNAEVANEALRALRGFDLSDGEKQQLTELAARFDGPRQELVQRALDRNPPENQPKPEDQAAWLKLAAGEGDPQLGERIFHHARVGGCYRCHEFEGRGFQVGPDLTNIGRTMTRERLVQSITDPSREIAPMFTNWSILTTDGEVKTGVHVGDEVDGRIKFADPTGRVFHVHPNDVDRRQPSTQSVMPANLVHNLTAQELRDLLAFLQGTWRQPGDPHSP